MQQPSQPEQTPVASPYPAYRLSIAPMLDLTDRHCRYFLRQFSRHLLLYTEMISCGAILHSKADYLDFSPEEQPLALQLGGNDPVALAHCARLAQERGYQEINLNVGCPSDKVHNAQFGACLMAQPALVASCVQAMGEAVNIPVTVKTRIGIDQQDSYPFLCDFIGTVAQGGCQQFIIHARKAWLAGLSPKENRQIPPLDYQRVWQLKRDFPQLTIILNGGIQSLDEACVHLQHVDGVMIGRAAYQQPEILAGADRQIFADPHTQINASQAVRALYPYIQQQLNRGTPLNHITRHLLGLFHGKPGARQWRRHLSEQSCKTGAGIAVIEQALAQVAGDK